MMMIASPRRQRLLLAPTGSLITAAALVCSLLASPCSDAAVQAMPRQGRALPVSSPHASAIGALLNLRMNGASANSSRAPSGPPLPLLAVGNKTNECLASAPESKVGIKLANISTNGVESSASKRGPRRTPKKIGLKGKGGGGGGGGGGTGERGGGVWEKGRKDVKVCGKQRCRRPRSHRAANVSALVTSRRPQVRKVTGVREKGRAGGWKRMFANLLQFRMVHGNSSVGDKFWCCECSSSKCSGCKGDPGDLLGPWVRVQLKRARKGKLVQSRTDLLCRAGTLPVAPKDHVCWEQRLLELLVFRSHHGHVSVPAWPEGGPLGTWVMRQKRKKARGELAESQIKALSGAGFSWNERDVMWENQFWALLGFAQRHGTCNVPKRYTGVEGLSYWVAHQRREAKKGTLQTERVRRLTDLGFTWDFSVADVHQPYPLGREHNGLGRVMRVPPYGNAGGSFFTSEGLVWDVPVRGCWEESAQDVVIRAGRGEFDRDWIDKAVEEGAIGAAEATDWSALYNE